MHPHLHNKLLITILGYNSKPEEKQAFINTVKRPFQPFQLMWVSSALLPGSTLLLHCRCLSSLLCCHHRLHSFPSGRHGILRSRHSSSGLSFSPFSCASGWSSMGHCSFGGVECQHPKTWCPSLFSCSSFPCPSLSPVFSALS